MGESANRILARLIDQDDLYRDVSTRQQQHQQSSLAKKRLEIERLAQLENLRSQSAHHAASIFGLGYAGFGNGWTEAKPRILYPKERKRYRRHLREVVFTRDAIRQASQSEEVLAPIRLDLDFDTHKLRDTFLWNLSDQSLSFETFASHLCEDYGLPQVGFVPEIQKSIRNQLAEHHPHKFPDEQGNKSAEAVQKPIEPCLETKDDDLRILIRLDITIGVYNLIDQFEWDINNSQNDAERFAESICGELGLVSEFRSAIAHSIREQSQMYTKSLFLVGHSFDGSAVQDTDMRQLIIPTVFTSLRPKHHLDKFAPLFRELTSDQLERNEREREREGRRNRRQTRGKRGATLPDLTDLPKTYRTPYTNTVLVSEGEERADNYTAPGVSAALNEVDEISEEDDRYLGDASPRAERSTRSARALRMSTSQNKVALYADDTSSQTGRQHHHAPDFEHRPYGHHLSGKPRSPQMTTSHGLRAQDGADHFINPPLRSPHYTSGLITTPRPQRPTGNRGAMRSTSSSPERSLIVKLKLPKFKYPINRDSQPPHERFDEAFFTNRYSQFDSISGPREVSRSNR